MTEVLMYGKSTHKHCIFYTRINEALGNVIKIFEKIQLYLLAQTFMNWYRYSEVKNYHYKK